MKLYIKATNLYDPSNPSVNFEIPISFEIKKFLKGALALELNSNNAFQIKIDIFQSYQFDSNWNIFTENQNILQRIYSEFTRFYNSLFLIFQIPEDIFIRNKKEFFYKLPPFYPEPVEYFGGVNFEKLKKFYISFRISDGIVKKIETINKFIKEINQVIIQDRFIILIYLEYLIIAINVLYKEIEILKQQKEIEFENLRLKLEEVKTKLIYPEDDNLNLDKTITKAIAALSLTADKKVQHISNNEDFEKENYSTLFEKSIKLLRNEYEKILSLNNYNEILYMASIIRRSELVFHKLKTKLKNNTSLKNEFYNLNSGNRMKMSLVLNRKRNPTMDFIVSYLTTSSSETPTQDMKEVYAYFNNYNELNSYINASLDSINFDVFESFEFSYLSQISLPIDLSEFSIDVEVGRNNNLVFPQKTFVRFICIQYMYSNPWNYFVGVFERIKENNEEKIILISINPPNFTFDERNYENFINRDIRIFLIKNMFSVTNY
nr:hypothetical protein [Fusobacterium gastrosuis]